MSKLEDKWENKYEEYKNGRLDMKIDKLRRAWDESHTNREEYNNLVKYERIRDNLPKVGNLLEYRRELETFLDGVDKELYRRERLTKITQETEKLDKNMKKIEEDYLNVEEQLKDKNLSQEEREELNSKKLEILSKRDENNKNYAKGQEELNTFLGGDNKFSDKSDEQLKGLALEANSRISKCNMAGRNLIEGKSWDYVEYVLDNWKEQTKYTGRRKIAEEAKKAKDNKELEEEQKKFTDKNINDLEKPEKEELEGKAEVDNLEDNTKVDDEEKDFSEDENELFTNYEFDEDLEKADNELANRPKHPILEKIKNFFKNVKNMFHKQNIYEQYSDYCKEYNDHENSYQDETKNKTDDEVEKKIDNEVEEKVEKEEINNKKEYNEKDLGLDKDMRTWLRDVADKGLEGLSEKEKAERKKAAEEKLAAMRAANRAAEAAKFNGKGSFKKRDYAAQSDYRQQNNEEIR